MELIPTDIPDIKVIVPRRFGDNRGFFAETYNRKLLEGLGIHDQWVQDNHSLSVEMPVVRGLHYQLPPMAQAKLVRVARGAILDVVVDIRRNSPTFGKHVAVELTDDNFRQIYVPAGFAHGFVTLAANTEVLYKVSNYYSPQHERGVLWNDPALGIDWRIDASRATLSAKDRQYKPLQECADLFD